MRPARVSNTISTCFKCHQYLFLVPQVSTSTEPDSEIKIPAGFKIPEPQRFAVASGQLGSIAAAGVAPLMRLGAGLFCLGYTPSHARVTPNAMSRILACQVALYD